MKDDSPTEAEEGADAPQSVVPDGAEVETDEKPSEWERSEPHERDELVFQALETLCARYSRFPAIKDDQQTMEGEVDQAALTRARRALVEVDPAGFDPQAGFSVDRILQEIANLGDVPLFEVKESLRELCRQGRVDDSIERLGQQPRYRLVHGGTLPAGAATLDRRGAYNQENHAACREERRNAVSDPVAQYQPSEVEVVVNDLEYAQARYSDSPTKTFREKHLGKVAWELFLCFALNDGRLKPPDHKASAESLLRDHAHRGRKTEDPMVRADLRTKRTEFKRQRDTWLRQKNRLNKQLRELLGLSANPFEAKGDFFVSRFKALRHDTTEQ